MFNQKKTSAQNQVYHHSNNMHKQITHLEANYSKKQQKKTPGLNQKKNEQ